MQKNYRRLALLIFITAVGLVACAKCKEPNKIELKPGMDVVAAWTGNSWWVAKIDSINGDDITVTYSDNTKGTKPKTQVLPHPKVQYSDGKSCCFKPGDQVVAKWKNDNWWIATIDGVEDGRVKLTYSDGVKGNQSSMDIVRYAP